jgi:hypothetical protein
MANIESELEKLHRAYDRASTADDFEAMSRIANEVLQLETDIYSKMANKKWEEIVQYKLEVK